MSKEQRDHFGMLGHDWVNGNESHMSSQGMSDLMAEYIQTCLDNWTPRKRFTMYKVEQLKKIENPGVVI